MVYLAEAKRVSGDRWRTGAKICASGSKILLLTHAFWPQLCQDNSWLGWRE